MKLYTAKATPFGRTVEIVAHEIGLHEDMEIVATAVAPGKPNDEYQTLNPLKKIPALVTEDVTLIADSGLISEYLAARVGDTALFGVNDPNRWAMLNDYMLAKGAADVFVAARYETFARPEEFRWKDWSDDMLKKGHAVLARFDATPPESAGRITIAQIALGAVLGYLDFRFPQEEWRNRYPALAKWAAPIHERPSFMATRPD